MAILHDEPEIMYHARPQVSNSMLKWIDVSPYHWWARYEADEPIEEDRTAALIEGTAFHCLVLEPDLFDKRFYIAPDIRRGTKEWKKHEEAAEGRIILKKSERDNIQGIADAVRNHRQAASLLERATYKECTVLWEDPGTGIKCRGRLDLLGLEPGNELMVDFKKAKDASPRAFNKAVFNYRYDCQSGMYTDGLALCGEEQLESATSWPFYWVVVEPKPPYAVGVYAADEDWVAVGRARYRRSLERVRACRESNEWPSYTKEIGILKPPAWALNHLEGDPELGVTEVGGMFDD